MQTTDLFAESRQDLFFILGPCVLESRDLGLQVGEKLAEVGEALGKRIVFKASFDKANRSSPSSFRGPGLEQGLKDLERIRRSTGLPVLTDIHHPDQAEPVAEVADALQIPAFLCRQTDLVQAAARTGLVVNVKKGQFLAPWDMAQVARKAAEAGNERLWLTERGSSFGYNNLVVDFRSFAFMKETGMPTVFDATHSVQLPGGRGESSGGQSEFVPVLARSAVAAGCDGVFMEVHPEPEQALCDGPNSWPLYKVDSLLRQLTAVYRAVRENPFTGYF
mgnify:CR=1 FL=1